MGEILPYIPFLPASSSSAPHYPRTNFYLHLHPSEALQNGGVWRKWDTYSAAVCSYSAAVCWSTPALPGGVRRVTLLDGKSLLSSGWGL